MVGSVVLVIEDEKDVRELVVENLIREGFCAIPCGSGLMGLQEVRNRHPDLILLDVMLPDLDGIEVCRQLKWDAETRPIPVIMVTARGEERDVVLGLGIGADDYIVKPFRMGELVARLKAVLRRVRGPITPTAQGLVELGPVAVDLDKHEARVDGKSIRVTPTELRFLYLLVSRPGVVLTRAEIIRSCSPGEGNVSDHLVDVYVQLLRRKLGRHKSLLQTIRGVGYRMAEP